MTSIVSEACYSISDSRPVQSPYREMFIKMLANSVDPDQTAPEEQSDLDQHCLLRHPKQSKKSV